MSNDMRNFTQPTYALFLHDVAGAAVKCWQNMESSHKFPAAWLKMISQYGSVTYTDIALVVVLAIIWTLCRYLASNFIFRVSCYTGMVNCVYFVSAFGDYSIHCIVVTVLILIFMATHGTTIIQSEMGSIEILVSAIRITRYLCID